MLIKNLKYVLGVAILSSFATFAYAEDAAPVYDADSYPPPFDGQADAGASLDNQQPQQNLSPTVVQSTNQTSTANKIEHIEEAKDESSKIDMLQSDLQSLRGQVEQLSHQLQLSQKPTATKTSDASKNEVQALRAEVDQLTQQIQQLQSSSSKATPVKKSVVAMNSDDAILVDSKTTPGKSKVKAAPPTDANIAKAKPLATVVTNAVTKKNDSQPNVAEEQQIYQTAYDLIKVKKYNEAIAALQKMLQKYPTGQFAANAHYWLGELYGLMSKNDESALEFGNVVTDFPDSPKVADAQLKLGLIYVTQLKWLDAKTAFKKVINHYPGTTSARLAAEQLKQIKQAGH